MWIVDCVEQIKATAAAQAYTEAAKLIEHNTQATALEACQIRAEMLIRKAQRLGGSGAVKDVCEDAAEMLVEAASGADIDALLGLNGRQAS